MHTLPPLPYADNALEPVISAQTLRIHHDYHHRSYVEGLNHAELKLEEARQTLDFSLIKHWEREVAFYGSGHILHSIYWTNMQPPKANNYPSGQIGALISSDFRSWPTFKTQFSEAAKQIEGSGWAILAWQPPWQRLVILTAEKHQNLTQWGVIPLLVLDVWEHAYYLDYQYQRQTYIEAWWDLVNWGDVEKRLHEAMPASMHAIP